MRLFKPNVAQRALFYAQSMVYIFASMVVKLCERRVRSHPKALERIGIRIIADDSYSDSQFVEQEKVFQALLLLEKTDNQLFRRVSLSLSTIHVRTHGPSSRLMWGGYAVVNLASIPEGISHPAAIAHALVGMATRVVFEKRRLFYRGRVATRINEICYRDSMRAFGKITNLYRPPGITLQK
jgi:hypothetical protein